MIHNLLRRSCGLRLIIWSQAKENENEKEKARKRKSGFDFPELFRRSVVSFYSPHWGSLKCDTFTMSWIQLQFEMDKLPWEGNIWLQCFRLSSSKGHLAGGREGGRWDSRSVYTVGLFHLLEGVFKQRSSGHADLYVLRPGQLLRKREENVSTRA